MDQPGMGHTMHTSQGTLNGGGGYYGRAGYDGNDHGGDGHQGGEYGNGFSGQASNGQDGYPGQAAGYPSAAVRVPRVRKPSDSRPAPDTEVAQNGSTQDIALTEGVPPAATRRGGTHGRDGGPRDEGSDFPASPTAPADEVTDAPVTDAPDTDAPDADAPDADAPDTDGLDPDGQAPDGEAPADDGTGAGDTTAGTVAYRIRELLARSTADHAATERATTAALDDIRLRLATLELTVAEIREYTRSGQDVADRLADQLAPQAERLADMSATLDGLTAGLSSSRGQLSAIDGRLANVDGRLAGTDATLASTEGRVAALDTRFERLDERLDDQYDRVTSMENLLALTDSRVTTLAGQFAETMPPLAEELRARPARAEIEEMVTKVVYAAHSDLATRMSSLEDTVLTLAEALLRPAPGHAPQGI